MGEDPEGMEGARENMNRVFLAGRLTRDMERKTTTTGKSVATGSIAVRRTETLTDFIDIELWNAQADRIATRCHKGDYILCAGEIRKDSYTKKDGTKGYKQYVTVQYFESPNKKSEGSYDDSTGDTKDPDFSEDADIVEEELSDLFDDEEELPF